MPNPIEAIPKVAIVSIGNELLLGKTINTNFSWLAEQLSQLGFAVAVNIVIADISTEIRSALEQTWTNYDIVIFTGGLGPTEDDISKAEIASFFGKELLFDDSIWAKVVAMFERRGLSVPLINRNQAIVPQGFIALNNELGTAPGLHYQAEQRYFFALPGMPMEMKHLFEVGVKPLICENFSLTPIYQKTIHTFGIGESALAEKLSSFVCPDNINLAWLPQTGRVDLRLYGHDRESVSNAVSQICALASEYIWGFDEETPFSLLHRMLIERNLSLSVAESCTGGMIQERIVGQADASVYFVGGVVSYANDIKNRILAVSNQTLVEHGAVSAECAMQMAEGVRKLMNSDLSLSVTGIAGPSGGSPDKPVGTVFFGISSESGTITHHVIFNGTRDSIRYKATEFAVIKLIDAINGRSL